MKSKYYPYPTDACGMRQRHPLYRVWTSMFTRCYHLSHAQYADYGGRGIEICKEWFIFSQFIADVGERPFPGAQLDRINSDGNYEAGNVQWVTRSINLQNRRKYKRRSKQ